MSCHPQASFLDTNYRDHTGWETSSISSGSNAGPSTADETRHVDGSLRPTNWFLRDAAGEQGFCEAQSQTYLINEEHEMNGSPG